MKKTSLLAICWLIAAALYAQGPGFANLHILDPYNPESVPGEVLVKFRDDAKVKVRNLKSGPTTGLASIDAFIARRGVTTCEKVFAGEEKRSDKKYITTPDGQTREMPQLFNIYCFKAGSNADVKSMVDELKKDPVVEFAEPNYYFYSMETLEKPAAGNLQPTVYGLQSTVYGLQSPIPSPQSTPAPNIIPNDPMYSQQWYLPAVNALAAWDSTTGDTTQIIGIIDTGVDWTHPDLSPNIWTNWDEISGNGVDDDGNGKIDDRRGWDFVNNDNNPMDDNSHGTHVAGIAAAKGNNSIGIAGVVWNSKIMPIKVMQSSGYGSSSDIANGVNYARLNGATVLNLSLGSYGESLTLKTALENAYSTAVILAAAGNDKYSITRGRMYPACYSWILGIQASNTNGALSSYSNYDPNGPVITEGFNYEIKAPGVGILSTLPNGGYHQLNGTSMATPIVSGAVALIKSFNPTITTEQIFARLIQSDLNNLLNISSAMNINLVPNLYFLSYSLVDTLPGSDNDGIADAGEMIQLYLNVMNGGDFADSVWSKIRFAPYEDTTVATIIDSTSNIGNISSYASLTGLIDPFRVYIKPWIANNRDITLQYEIGAKNSTVKKQGVIVLTVQNGQELHGVYFGTERLKPNRLYIVTDHAVFDTLIIDPGTILRFNSSKRIIVLNKLSAQGKRDSLIYFTKNQTGGWSGIQAGQTSYKYCVFEFKDYTGYPFATNIDTMENCIIRFCESGPGGYNNINKCVFIDNAMTIGISNNSRFYNNIFTRNCSWQYIDVDIPATYYFRENFSYNNASGFAYRTNGNAGLYKFRPNYYGTTDSTIIEKSIRDFFESGQMPVVSGFDSAQIMPSPSCHGCVWKVCIDSIEINKYDHQYNKPFGLGIVGPGWHRFDIYFNRAMNISFTPFVTFGVRSPYTQRQIIDSTSWSPDSLRWTAFFNIGIETGDGIQRVRVEGARDNEHFEIPIENSRFEFVIQAAGSASIEFIATPGIGKVYLEWNRAGTEDAMGYNMYRYYNLTDSTFSAPVRINSSLITDTLFTDFGVIPDTTYHFYYKVVGTDLQESDSSKIIVAVPLAAANGDANGDMSVSVLDITAVIAYMLNQNPQPFLFDAADVNSDNTINVLDVIGIVDIILGKKKLVSPTITSNPDPAYIYLDNDRIRFRSDGQVAALQFELAGQNLEQIRLLMKQPGFEFATGIVNGKLMGILYNLDNRTLPAGMIDLVGIEGVSKPLAWGDVTAGDPLGQYVLVLKDAKGPVPVSTTELTAIPNPFKDRVTITYRLIEQASIQLDIFDAHGQLIRVLETAEKPSGTYSIEWNGKNVASGLYYCRLCGKTVIGQELKSEIKIMLTK